jgi:aflatoxin B1 aldehyde reductase
MTFFQGAGSFGLPGPQSNGARIHSVEMARETIGVYVHHGYATIDAARLYGGGTSEEVSGRAKCYSSVTNDTQVHWSS